MGWRACIRICLYFKKMKKHEPVKSFNGISVILLRGAMGKHYMKDWTEEQVKEYEDWVGINS